MAPIEPCATAFGNVIKTYDKLRTNICAPCVTHVRLVEAARLLHFGDKTITAIADLTGFSDQHERIAGSWSALKKRRSAGPFPGSVWRIEAFKLTPAGFSPLK